MTSQPKPASITPTLNATAPLNPLVPVAAATLIAVTSALGLGAFALSRLTKGRINAQRD